MLNSKTAYSLFVYKSAFIWSWNTQKSHIKASGWDKSLGLIIMPYMNMRMYVHEMAYFILLKEGLFRTIITLTLYVILWIIYYITNHRYIIITIYTLFVHIVYYSMFSSSFSIRKQKCWPKHFIRSTRFTHQNLRKHVFYKCIWNIFSFSNNAL